MHGAASRRVGVTVWNGRVSPVLDTARTLRVHEIGQDGTPGPGREEALPGTDPVAQAARLSALRPNVLICGAASRPLAERLAAGGIELVPFVAGEADRVLDAWRQGRLPGRTMCLPGCGGRRRGPGRGGGRGRGRGCGGGRGGRQP